MGSIIIVDDMELTLELMKSLLIYNGINDVQTFISPLQVLHHLHDHAPPDIIVTDFRMPEMNGLDLLTTITSSFPNTYGIIMSGNILSLPHPAHKFFLIEKGGDDFFKRLICLIEQILSANHCDLFHKEAKPLILNV